jgi:hypothetical protein
MLAAALLGASLAAAASVPAPSESVRLEAELSSSAAARRLLLAAGDAPRREAHASGLPLAVDERGGEHPEIVLDLERLRALPPGEAEAEYARALARAAVAAPIATVEGEQACQLWTAQVLIELAPQNADVARALRAPPPKEALRVAELGRAAVFLAAFEKSPEDAFWLVESGPPDGAARLTDVEDLFALHGEEIRAAAAAPEGPYGVLAGRRYPAALVRAAFRLRGPGAIERLREALGAYDTVGAAALRELLLRFRRAAPVRGPGDGSHRSDPEPSSFP